ncbi:tellurite resistance TerB family protein [Guyparkeria halopsychrophila]|uniref:tellurite resistance TerB family protein n=1 Tax=Guyparkeria halopsychrophila TaxID=3139421 RepID=UPI0037C8076D
MLKTLRDLFFPGDAASPEESPRSVNAAVAILLMEVARADFDVADDELAIIRQAMVDDFGMTATEADDLVDHAAREVDDSTGFFPFVRVLNDRLGPAERSRVIEMLWEVAYADAGKHHLEESIIRQIAELLYVPHSEFVRARVRAEEAGATD